MFLYRYNLEINFSLHANNNFWNASKIYRYLAIVSVEATIFADQVKPVLLWHKEQKKVFCVWSYFRFSLRKTASIEATNFERLEITKKVIFLCLCRWIKLVKLLQQRSIVWVMQSDGVRHLSQITKYGWRLGNYYDYLSEVYRAASCWTQG